MSKKYTDDNKIYHKMFTDDEFNNIGPGHQFGMKHYETIVDTDKYVRGYYLDESGQKQILFKLMKNEINSKLQNIATNAFKKLSMKKNFNRGLAAGKPKGSKTARRTVGNQSYAMQSSTSNIAGYYDKPDRRHKYAFRTDTACRKTAFTKHNMDLWKSGLPFIEKCSSLYKKRGGNHYKRQAVEINKLRKELIIPNTVFTTVTVNYNWRTSCHKDTGDFSKGLGNLIVTGRDFTGCYLGFPQFKVCIKVEPGDFLLMDVHQWHCNTELCLTNHDGYRISYVMYIREDMAKCQKHIIVDGEEYYA